MDLELSAELLAFLQSHFNRFKIELESSKNKELFGPLSESAKDPLGIIFDYCGFSEGEKARLQFASKHANKTINTQRKAIADLQQLLRRISVTANLQRALEEMQNTTVDLERGIIHSQQGAIDNLQKALNHIDSPEVVTVKSQLLAIITSQQGLIQSLLQNTTASLLQDTTTNSNIKILLRHNEMLFVN